MKKKIKQQKSLTLRIKDSIFRVPCFLPVVFILFFVALVTGDVSLGSAQAALPDLEIVRVTPLEGGGQTYSISIQILLIMAALSLLPALVLSCTAFTRIIIVLSILRQAMGTAQTPPNQVLIGLALFITFVVMQPIFQQLYDDSITPFIDEQISGEEAVSIGENIFKKFMIANTRESDLIAIANLQGKDGIDQNGNVPFFSIVVPAFVVSELRTAFEIGFLLFVPFLVIDLVVSSVLMSLGMMMLSPMLVSLPFKLLLFVSVDGWAMTVGSLIRSFGPLV